MELFQLAASIQNLHPAYFIAFAAVVLLVYYFARVIFVNGVTCRSKERLEGKTAIITGGNTGIGKEVALDLARRGARVIIACRDVAKGRRAADEIERLTGNNNVTTKRLDLASFESVRNFVEKILEQEEKIHILIDNAGVMFVPYQLSKDGYELQFAVNHLGHFLLTNLLLDRIKESAPSRIVVVSSLGHLVGSLDFKDMMWKKRYNSQLSYCRSKLANVMFARELAKRLAGTGVTVCSLHPGTVHTEITRYFFSGWLVFLKPLAHVSMYLFTKTPKQGAQTTIHCAVAREVEGVSGKYWDDSAIKVPSRAARDDDGCTKLWEYSVRLVGLAGDKED